MESGSALAGMSAEVPVDEEIPARKTALSMLEEATTARDAGDYDQCMDYVQQAAGAMRCQYGAGDRLECPTN